MENSRWVKLDERFFACTNCGAVMKYKSNYCPNCGRAMKAEVQQMSIDRAIEILNPEHREHYSNVEIVNDACRLGVLALQKMKFSENVEECPE